MYLYTYVHKPAHTQKKWFCVWVLLICHQASVTHGSLFSWLMYFCSTCSTNKDGQIRVCYPSDELCSTLLALAVYFNVSTWGSGRCSSCSVYVSMCLIKGYCVTKDSPHTSVLWGSINNIFLKLSVQLCPMVMLYIQQNITFNVSIVTFCCFVSFTYCFDTGTQVSVLRQEKK